MFIIHNVQTVKKTTCLRGVTGLNAVWLVPQSEADEDADCVGELVGDNSVAATLLPLSPFSESAQQITPICGVLIYMYIFVHQKF